MSLLQEIQSSLIQDTSVELGQVLLKLRFLASRLGSDLLEEWIKHELDGYPDEIPVPNYRKVGVTYKGTFSGAFGSGLDNAPIPSALIMKHAGERWVNYEMRQSIAEIDNLLRSGKDTESTLQIDASNLILLLQNKVYPGMACNSITGLLSTSEVAGLHFSVQNRVLDLTIDLERKVPVSTEIVTGKAITIPAETAKIATRVAHQSIYAENFTVIFNSGEGNQSVSVSNFHKGDRTALGKALVEGGIDEADASEFAAILSEEKPLSEEEPFGEKALAWIAKNLEKSAKGSWQMSKEIAKKLLTEAAIAYYFK